VSIFDRIVEYSNISKPSEQRKIAKKLNEGIRKNPRPYFKK
jgi:hypothetical protein